MGNMGSLSYLCENTRRGTKHFQRRSKKWTRWKPITEEQSLKFKKVMEKNDSTEDVLDSMQKNIENAAGEVAHRTRA